VCLIFGCIFFWLRTGPWDLRLYSNCQRFDACVCGIPAPCASFDGANWRCNDTELYSGSTGLESWQVHRLLWGFVVVFFSSCSLPCTYVQIKLMYSTRLYVLVYALLSGAESFHACSLWHAYVSLASQLSSSTVVCPLRVTPQGRRVDSSF